MRRHALASPGAHCATEWMSGMYVDLGEVELGFFVSLGVLREAIKELNVDGRRWWISSDPLDAAEFG